MYVLKVSKELMELLTHFLIQPIKPDNGPMAQYSCNTWFEKGHSTCFMLSSMHHDLIGKYEYYPIAKDLWDHLKFVF